MWDASSLPREIGGVGRSVQCRKAPVVTMHRWRLNLEAQLGPPRSCHPTARGGHRQEPRGGNRDPEPRSRDAMISIMGSASPSQGQAACFSWRFMTSHPWGRSPAAAPSPRCPWHRGCSASPRARGTQQRHLQGELVQRFIPAGAGNARRRQRHRPPLAVHPRGRGERACDRGHRERASGSSPRARGTLAWD